MKIHYTIGYKYQVAKAMAVNIQLNDPPVEVVNLTFLKLIPGASASSPCTLIVKEGYAWDGASGPAVDSPNFMRGSCVHDALYQLLRMEKISAVNRERADRILVEICAEDGMPWWRCKWVYWGVSRYAGFAASPRNARKILTAP